MANFVTQPQLTPLIGVVEPDADVREFIESVLIRAGYRCEAFVSGERFEHVAAHTFFDCVVTDSDLPGMDGLELARRLQRSNHPVPVLMLTSDLGADLQREALAAQVVRVQKKPLAVREFLHSVEETTRPH